LRPTSDGVKILGVPLGASMFVENFIRKKFDAIDASLALAATIPDARIAYNIHRVTASACRMTHLLRLIPPADAMTLWTDFYDRQSAWFEKICNVPRSVAARRQARLPRSLAGLGIYAAVDVSPCAYFGSLIQSADVRAIDREHAPTAANIHAVARRLVDDLQPALAATAGGVLPPSDPLLLSGLPESPQTVLSQAVFQKRLREALREDEFHRRFSNPRAPVPLSKELPAEDWNLLFTRRRILALLRPGANAFLSTKPDDTPFCSTDMWSMMMRIYLGCYVYDDSSTPTLLRCGCCDELVLDKLGIHAITACSTGWGRVARHDRQATIFLKWLASPAGLAFQGKYGGGEALGLLFGTSHRPADALVFPPPTAPGEDPGLTTAIDFLVTGPFTTTNRSGRVDARNAAAYPDAITDAGELRKTGDYRRKVRYA